VIGAYAPVVLGCDGTFDQSADRGLRFDADMAGANALTTVPHLVKRADAVEAQAEASYRRSARSLGSPTAPKSPDTDLVGPAIDIVTGGLVDAGTDELVDRARQGGPFRGFLPGRR
jgi:guanyl-specific ribonuclease Sa